MQLVKQLWSLFNRRERWQLGILTVALILRAGVEMVGVASIMPFMSVVADPDIVHTNAHMAAVYEWFGFESVTAFLTAMGAALVVVLVVANAFSAGTLYAMLRFVWGMHHRLSMRLLKGYLAQPYGFFTQRNSASLNKTLLAEVQQVISGVMSPAVNIVARALVIAALTMMLFVLDPVLALIIVAVMGGTYLGIYLVVKKKQRQWGRDRVEANRVRFKVTGEAFGGIKDVKVLQREQSFLDQFRPASWIYSKTTASSQLIAHIPRYLIEAVAFGGIVLIVLYYLQAGGGVAQILPVISLYAFAGYRLLPELQQLFYSVASVRFYRAALDDLADDLKTVDVDRKEASAGATVPFEHAIAVDDLTFTYAGSPEPALKGITLRIERNQTVGLVGPSGCGKTTLVDLLLGLYTPDGGRILVDGTALDERNIRSWQRQVGYVPQHIFLTDDTIAANIAFGVPPAEMDREAIERAARIAHLHAFIQSLPAGYETVVGERGVRLSGGQRQRIGIARALYHDPDVLIMDEATSALDGATEDAVMQAIRDLAGRKTIVVIAHRLSTVEECDRIFLVDAGRNVDTGTYEELVDSNSMFRSMARLPAAEEAVRGRTEQIGF